LNATIWERFHLQGRRWVVLVVVAIVGAALVLTYGLVRKTDSTAKSVVWVARVLPAGSGGDVGSSVADFETTIKLASIEQEVATRTGQSVSSIDKGISFSNIGSSSAVGVSYSASSPSVAGDVVSVAARDSLLQLARQSVAGAKAQVTAGNAALRSAMQAIRAFNAQNKVPDVDQAYTNGQQDLSNLETQLSSGQDVDVTALQSAISSEQSTIDRLGDALPRWQQLDGAVTQAVGALSSATANLVSANGQLIAARSASVLSPVHVTHEGRTTTVAILVVVEVVAVAVLGTLLFVGTDAREARRKMALRRKLAAESASS
jgi:hypothetical protein